MWIYLINGFPDQVIKSDYILKVFFFVCDFVALGLFYAEEILQDSEFKAEVDQLIETVLDIVVYVGDVSLVLKLDASAERVLFFLLKFSLLVGGPNLHTRILSAVKKAIILWRTLLFTHLIRISCVCFYLFKFKYSIKSLKSTRSTC